jgi:hypothetical protein
MTTTASEPTTGPVTDITVTEMVESLTGFDEIAIAKHFDGLDPYTDAQTKPILISRALVFVHLRRGNEQRARLSDIDAHTAAMTMPMGEVTTYFADGEDDDAAIELGLPAVTPSGEDVPPAA